MNQDMLCTWLGLPNKAWPPDHHTLLGLKPDEIDLARIERHVQERMCRLRCYQLSHPEEATEGMNRLAQAFICLSEAANRAAAAGPASVGQDNGAKNQGAKTSRSPVKDTLILHAKPAGDTAVLDQTKLDWRLAPPPVRSSPTTKVPPVRQPPATPAVDDRAALVHDLACCSPEARASLGTLAALIERVDQTRVLLTAWQRLGSHLRQKKTGADLVRQLAIIRDVTDVYPAFIGHPGKPGYRVVALARLAMTQDMLQHMEQTQRDELLRDWDTGEKLLLEHRRYLRRQFKSMRHHGSMRLAVRAVRSLINDHPFLCGAAALLLIALGVALRLWLL